MLREIFRRIFGNKEEEIRQQLSVYAQDIAQHLAPAGRKRILALDGGGVRGAMAIAVLERIEDLLRARHGNDPDFRLCDYYDLIGGTSTGSIIAAALAAKRFKASEIREIYFDLGPKVFKKSLFRQGATRAVFDGNQLLKLLDGVFGDMTLGSEEVTTGLAIVSKRIDTSSTWVMHNNPNAPFYDDPPNGDWLGNKHYPIKNIIRASTAAPHYFKPEKIEIVPGGNKGERYGLFMDGGITPHNNPAFQMIMLAGISRYGYGWTLTNDNILVTNIGTGSMVEKVPADDFGKRMHAGKTIAALTSMISGSEDFIELLMQWFGESPDPRHIDSEIGTLEHELLAEGPMFTYQRYQSTLMKSKLADELGLHLSDKEIKILRDMTNPKALMPSYKIGQVMAEKLVKPDHFPERFDLVR